MRPRQVLEYRYVRIYGNHKIIIINADSAGYAWN